MSHHPTCPFYPVARPCAFSCHLLPFPYAPSPKIPTYTVADAIQSTRLIRRDFEHPTSCIDQLSAARERASRNVHFEPGHAKSSDGVCESRPRRRQQSSSSKAQIIPRSILQNDTLPPSLPTVYIVTFAADSIPNRTANVLRLLHTQLPPRDPPIPHLYTIDARSFAPPVPALCREFSGISPVIQDVVMQDGRARKAVADSVADLLRCGERGVREVSMSVCCHAGTHRSVAIGERIAQGVKREVGRLGCVEGVKVVVRHVSRVKGRGDPF
ncbi:hypothetical protein HBH71_036910 [Parastagonospora nodorum]|nr:hypothetical protein HBH71_036910 [Parastagonospora nodorum]KAH5257330.1 hypothetical protein HBI72_123090 [Parastagonospora nodorum]